MKIKRLLKKAWPFVAPLLTNHPDCERLKGAVQALAEELAEVKEELAALKKGLKGGGSGGKKKKA